MFQLAPPPKATAACTIRGIARWTTVIVVACMVTVGFAAHSLWTKADRLVRKAIEAQIALMVPDWHVTFDDVHAQWNGEVRIEGLKIRASEKSRPIITVPEVLLNLDVNLLLEHQKVLVRTVRIQEPLITLRCDSKGRWNWQSLAKPKPTDSAPPDIVVENATISVQLAESSRWPATNFRLVGLHARANPDSRHGFSALAEGTLQHVGHMNVAGRFDYAHGLWSVDGRCGKVDLEGLVQSLVGVSPETRQRVASLMEANQRGRIRRALQLASLEASPVTENTDQETGDSVLEDIGVQADMRLEFHAGVRSKNSTPEFSVTADIRDGQITNSVLPIPLYEIKGHVELDNDKLLVKTLTASNGESGLLIDGQWDFRGEAPTRRCICRASDLQIGQGLRAYLPPELQVRFDQLQPSGRFNVDVEFDSSLSPIPLRLREFTVAEGALKHEMFPYLVEHIEGGIRQDGPRFELNFRGLAGGRKVTLDGIAIGVTPDAGVNLVIHAESLPWDAALLEAFAGSQNEKVRKLTPVLTSLNGSGVADWRIELERSFGAGQKFRLMRLRGNVSAGGLKYERFPYEIADLRGTIDYDRTVENTWYFRDLTGRHGGTQVTGQGSFGLDPAPGIFDLKLTALSVPIDIDLRDAATTASPGLEVVWKELAPVGTLDLSNLQIQWSPGTPVSVELPSIQLRDAMLTPRAVPYYWDRLSGSARWKDHRLTIHTVLGWHKDAYLEIHGGDSNDAEPLAYFEQASDGSSAWRLHLGDVKIRKLPVDDDLRSALPTNVREVVASIAPTLPIDTTFGLDLLSLGRDSPVTAKWHTRTAINGGDLTLGILVRNAKGVIDISNATYDGKDVFAVGSVEFEEAEIDSMSLPLTNIRGPFRVHGRTVTVGAPSWMELPPIPGASAYTGQPLTGTLYSGTVTLNSAAIIAEADAATSEYAVDVSLKEARLEEWARTSQPNTQLYGVVNGETSFRGVGGDPTRIRGQGKLRISPAALYELPVLANIFRIIQFQPPANNAFDYALADFDLQDGLIQFSKIELNGNAVSLVGRGEVGFAGPKQQSVDLQLATRVVNKTWVIGKLIEAVGKGWVGVHVVGTINAPRAVVEARIPLYEDFKGLMQAMERGPGQPPRSVLR